VGLYEGAFDARQPFSMTYRLRRRDGEYRWLLDNGAPFDRNGVFAGYFGSCIDVTAQQELEAHQQVLLSELQHRVKNNLQLIISFMALKARRVETEEARLVLEETIQRVRSVGRDPGALHDSGRRRLLGGPGPVPARTGGGRAERRRPWRGPAAGEAEPVRTSVTQAATLGLMVNELLTNALKYAFDEDGAGDLRSPCARRRRPRRDRGQRLGPRLPPGALNGGAGRAGSAAAAWSTPWRARRRRC
jgi:hypothetical protein